MKMTQQIFICHDLQINIGGGKLGQLPSTHCTMYIGGVRMMHAVYIHHSEKLAPQDALEVML